MSADKMPSDYLPAEDEAEVDGSESLPPPLAKPLTELVAYRDGDPNELLRYRFLCSGGGLLLVGPTGIGKSALSMQAMILWAIGRPMFEIHPARPLKSLLIQAENDEGDLAEMRDGVVAGLNLDPAEREVAIGNVLVAHEDARCGARFFTEAVRPLLEQHRPDLLWIDPALAYLGGDVSAQKDVGGFLRNLLNPLLGEFGCAAVVVHHTNKPPTGREKSEWSGSDFAYLGGGSAEWANWARAVLVVRSLGSHSVFELRAGKRGGRLGWKEADEVTKAYAKLIGHAKEPGVICWRDADQEEVPASGKARKKVPTKEDILIHVPVVGVISKEALRSKANAAAVALNKINPLIAELLDEGSLHEWKEKRAGTNPRTVFSRAAQTSEELAP